MSSYAKAGLGTTITWNGTTIAEVTKISDIGLSAKPIDITNLSHTIREYIPGLPEPEELKIEGNLYAGDTNGQIALKEALLNRTTGTIVIQNTSANFSWTATALVTKFSAGQADDKSAVSFSASFQISGTPVFGVTESTGISAFVLRNSSDSGDATAVNYMPTWAIGTYGYAVTYTTESSVRPKITAANHTIKIYVDDVYIETVSSGVAASAISISADAAKRLRIEVEESGKIPKNYYVTLARIS